MGKSTSNGKTIYVRKGETKENAAERIGAKQQAGVTAAQNKTIKQLVKKTRDLKNEQYRIINENGEVVLEKRGGKHEVAATVGEKREYISGAVTIHNHPNGGTFSVDDLNEFGFGARQLVVASPEGTYILTNSRYGTKGQYNGWLDMKNAMNDAGVTKERSSLYYREKARQVPAVKRQMQAMQRTSAQWVKAKEAGKPQATLNRLAERYNRQNNKFKNLLRAAERKAETQPFHDFYKQNASKYGFEYEFIKR